MRTRLFIVLLAGLVTLTGCGVSAVKPSRAGAPVSFSALHDRGTEVTHGPTATVVFDVDEFSYKPTFIDADVDSVLKLVLANDGTEQHSFVIEGSTVTATIDPNSTETRNAHFPAAGNYVFYCKFHRHLGMQGAIIVR